MCTMKVFSESDDETRAPTPFVILLRPGLLGPYFAEYEGTSTPGTPLGVGEDFVFAPPFTARSVRIEANATTPQWISLSEVLTVLAGHRTCG